MYRLIDEVVLFKIKIAAFNEKAAIFYSDSDML